MKKGLANLVKFFLLRQTILLFFTHVENIRGSLCFSSLKSGLCSTCYQTDFLTDEMGCQGKEAEMIFLSRAVFVDPLCAFSNCSYGQGAATYSDLFEALTSEQKIAEKYFVSKIIFYLLGKEMALRNLKADAEAFRLMRRLNAEVEVKPWLCKFHTIRGCLQTNEKTTIFLKGRFEIFVTNSLRIENVVLDGSDMLVFPEEYAADSNYSALFCTEERKRNPASSCNIDAKTFEEPLLKAGVFVLEPLIDSPNTVANLQVPYLQIISSELLNMNLVNQTLSHLISKTDFAFSIYFFKVSLRGCFFGDGLLYKIDYFEERRSLIDFQTKENLKNMIKTWENLKGRIVLEEISFLHYNDMSLSLRGFQEKKALILLDFPLEYGLIKNMTFASSRNGLEDLTPIIIKISNLQAPGGFSIETFSLADCENYTFIFIESSSVNLSSIAINASSLKTAKQGSFISISKYSLVRLSDLRIGVSRALGGHFLAVEFSEVSIAKMIWVSSEYGDLLSESMNLLLIDSFSIVNCSMASPFIQSRSSVSLKITALSIQSSGKKANASTNVKALLYFSSENLVLDKLFVTSSRGYAIFDFNKVREILINASVFYDIANTDYIFSPTLSVTNITLNSTLLTKIVGLQSLFSYYSPNIEPCFFNLHNSEISDIDFKSFAITTGYLETNFVNCSLKNLKLGSSVRSFAKITNFKNHSIVNVIIIDVGFVTDPRTITRSYDKSLFTYWAVNNLLVKNLYFSSPGELALRSGIINSYLQVDSVLVEDCFFEMRYRKPGLSYLVLVLLQPNSINLRNVTVKQFTCDIGYGSLFHENGVISLLGTQSYSYHFQLFSLSIKNVSFFDNICVNGACLGTLNYHFINVEDCFFFNSNASQLGGHVSFIHSTDIKITNTVFQNSSSQIGGSIYFINSATALLTDCTFYMSRSSEFGGALYAESVKEIFVLNSTFFYGTVQRGHGGFIFSTRTNLSMANCFLHYFFAIDGNGGAVYNAELGSISLENCSFSNMEAVEGGWIYVSEMLEFMINNVTVKNSNAELSGGALSCLGAQKLTVIGLSLQNISSGGNGALFISFEQSGTLEIANLSCTANEANEGSCLYYESSNDIKVANLSITSCIGSGIFASWYSVFAFEIENLNVYAHRISEDADGNSRMIIFFEVGLLDIKHAAISESECEGGILLIRSASRASLRDFTIENIYIDLSVFQMYYIIHLEESSEFEMADAVVSNTKTKYEAGLITAEVVAKMAITNLRLEQFRIPVFLSGVIFLSECEEVTIFSSIFSNNQGDLINSRNSKVAIYFSFFTNNLYREKFSWDGATETPNDVLFFCDFGAAFFPMCSLRIEGSVLNNALAGLFIYGENSAEICIANSKFLVTFSDDARYNSFSRAVTLHGYSSLALFNTTFSNFYSNYGGVLQLAGSKDLSPFGVLNITDCTFFNNTAIRGGVMYVEGDINITILRNKFEQNKAVKMDSSERGVGGACVVSGSSSNTIMISANNFTRNYAEFAAPNIFSVFPLKIHSDNFYLENKDGLEFSNDSLSGFLTTKLLLLAEMSSAKSVEAMENISYAASASVKIIDGETYEVVSGASYSLLFALIDNQGQVVSFDSSSNAYLEILRDEADQISSPRVDNHISRVQKGLIIFNGTVFKSSPDSKSTLKITVEVDNSLFKAAKPTPYKAKVVKLYFRDCLRGEIKTLDGICFKCPAGSYSLLDPKAQAVSSQRKCLLCPKNAVCPGGDQITPQAGFWRANNGSTQIIECIRKKYCVGFSKDMKNSADKVTGECWPHHKGNLCQQCEEGFGRLGQTSFCESCDKNSASSKVKTILIVIILFGYITFLVFLYTRFSKDNNNSLMGEILKIAISHIQHTSIIFLADVPWTEDFKGLFAWLSVFSFFTDDALASECLSQQITSYDSVIFKLYISLVLPIGLSALGFLFWLILGVFSILLSRRIVRIKLRTKLIFKRALITLLIGIYIMYPMLIKTCLSFFDCFVLENNSSLKYMKESPNVVCWEGLHFQWVVYIAVPGLIVWGVLAPAAILFLMHYMRSKMNRVNEKVGNKKLFEPVSRVLKIGAKQVDNFVALPIYGDLFWFLQKEYRPELYFWEVLIFLKKFALIFVVTFKEFFNVETRMLILIMFLLLFCYLNVTYQPFINPFLNKLELQSLAISFFTALLAIFMFTEFVKDNSSVFFAFLFSLNGIFGVYIIYVILGRIKGGVVKGLATILSRRTRDHAQKN